MDRQLLAKIGPQTSVYRYRYCNVWPTKSREFIILQHWRVLKDRTIVLLSISVDWPDCPVQLDYVRGRILNSGWVIGPIFNGTASEITVIYQADLGGNVPQYILKSTAYRQPTIISNMANILAHRDLSIYEK